MSLVKVNGALAQYVSDKVKGFEVRRITAVSGIYVVDKDGYIGIKINDYFSQNGSPYPGNYALVAKGPSYKDMGLGQVTFLEVDSAVIGDKEYQVATMPDGKVWMCQNLDFKADGISINPNGSPYTAAAWYYSRDESTYGWEGKKYGLLYNWYAAKALTIAGWHLPSTQEWDTLRDAIGSSVAGTKLKSTTDWSSGNGTDNYGFNAKPSGYYVNGSFGNLGSNAYFWTSDENNSSSAYGRYLNTGATMDSGYSTKTRGYSVRLVKDS